MAKPYQPDEETQSLISDTNQKCTAWRMDRQPHEQQWFITSAFDRGQQYIEWNDKFQRLIVPPSPPHRVRIKSNRMQAKNRARDAKFLKNRPKPLVIPATTEFQDYLDARATQKAIDYLWRKLRLEVKVKRARLWARNCSKGFWWYHWNPTAEVRIMIQDPTTGQNTYQMAPLGDIEIEVGSPFEVLVSDPGCSTIAEQPEIMRIKLRKIDDVKQRYPEFADFLEPDSGTHEMFRFERNIASLNPMGYNMAGAASKDKGSKEKNWILVKEHFIRPCGKYPHGCYRVIAGNVLVKNQEELPYGFWDLDNPYPVTEFVDMQMEGQFWTPTLAEQMIDIQKEHNLMLSKVGEHVRVAAFPKLLVAKQHQLSKAAWTTEAGEIIEYTAIPNIDKPQAFNPSPILSDVWNMMGKLDEEFDVITQIWPSAEGDAAGATSGFQTNLLQEAADSVHAPDIRAFELAIEEVALKLRRMMKLGYDVPRLIATTGPNYQAEVFEFSSKQIDENADIQVEVGSGLPTLKSARQDTIMNLYNSGLLGDPADPEVRRRALGLLELGSVEEAFDVSKSDENQAKWENIQFSQWIPQPGPPVPQAGPDGQPLVDPMTGQPVMVPGPPAPPVEDPHFWENHLLHYNVHTTWLKSPEGRGASPQIRYAMIRHVVLHGRFINPSSALQIAMEEGITDVIPMLQALIAPAPGAPTGPEGPAGAAPPAPPSPPDTQAPPAPVQ